MAVKKGANMAALWPPFAKRSFPSWLKGSLGTGRSSQGRAVLGRGEASLDGDDRSKIMEQEEKDGEPLDRQNGAVARRP